MPKAKTPKNLVVDGTAKLAAKSKPSDKHEAPDLNIEEATVASPRPSRKRAGDYFDFDDGADAEKSSPPAKAVGKEKRPRKPKTAKDDVAEKKPKSSKKSKKATEELAADEKPNTEGTQKTAKAATKAKANKSKAEKGAAKEESSTVAPDVAMDEVPLETLLESEKGLAPGAKEKQPATGRQATKAAKLGKKPAKESKGSKIESAKASVAETAADSAEAAKKGAKAGAEKVKKAAKIKAPATEKAADAIESVRKGVKVGPEKAKQSAKSMAPIAEAPANVADVVKKDAKAGAEKMKKGAKSKDSKPAKNDELAKLTGLTEEQSKPEASKSKKRKAPAIAEIEMVKTNVLDPLSEHASAKKRQKKGNTKSNILGHAVGELIATATEGANAAKASLGGLATSILGGASETVDGEMDANEPANAPAKTTKGKGKAIAEDVAESSGKTATIDGSGDADPEDTSDDGTDDLTTALIDGLESDGDEGLGLDAGFKQGQEIPRLPEAEITAKKLEEVKNGADEGPGVVYVGRIPHGFYEHEMRAYFSQFGDIRRLRLSRSWKNGASRHYAFLEFTSAGVAKIVADTMDNYLMFGHILRCKVVAKEQVHESLWKGANKRFKAVPWNKIEGRKFEVGLGREQWSARIEGEKKRRASKNEKTKEIGYEFQAGELKSVDEVPVRAAEKKIENGEKVEEEKSLVTAGGEDGNGPVVVSEEVKTKRVKKVKGKAEETTTAVAKKTKRALDVGNEAVGSAAKKAKKAKKTAA
ncbi:hypothetical protein IMSHALPRED_001860 [Imshaugia aleurites]|uniref:RRM domain-containing protein n=1 Tax=Imshaugia aleurites TaxID=172621 RepID=A0A8H3IDA2_9LECA|nr:hypothetical protein IMSHALPRED_001860 [Imshaugia aleurites]